MKNVLLLVRENSGIARVEEAIRVAAGLSQHPELQVSLRLPLAVPTSIAPDFLETLAEKGHRLYAPAQWLPLLPPSLHQLHQDPATGIKTSDFDLFIPF